MGQRLDDDAFLINKDDVSIPENFDIQRSRPIFGVKGKRKNSIKAVNSLGKERLLSVASERGTRT